MAVRICGFLGFSPSRSCPIRPFQTLSDPEHFASSMAPHNRTFMDFLACIEGAFSRNFQGLIQHFSAFFFRERKPGKGRQGPSGVIRVVWPHEQPEFYGVAGAHLDAAGSPIQTVVLGGSAGSIAWPGCNHLWNGRTPAKPSIWTPSKPNILPSIGGGPGPATGGRRPESHHFPSFGPRRPRHPDCLPEPARRRRAPDLIKTHHSLRVLRGTMVA